MYENIKELIDDRLDWRTYLIENEIITKEFRGILNSETEIKILKNDIVLYSEDGINLPIPKMKYYKVFGRNTLKQNIRDRLNYLINNTINYKESKELSEIKVMLMYLGISSTELLYYLDLLISNINDNYNSRKHFNIENLSKLINNILNEM